VGGEKRQLETRDRNTGGAKTTPTQSA
jgi:hypothetical protein